MVPLSEMDEFPRLMGGIAVFPLLVGSEPFCGFIPIDPLIYRVQNP